MDVITTGVDTIVLENFTLHRKGGFIVITSNKSPDTILTHEAMSIEDKKLLAKNMEDYLKKAEAMSKDLDIEPVPEQVREYRNKRSFCKICKGSKYDRYGKPCRSCK